MSRPSLLKRSLNPENQQRIDIFPNVKQIELINQLHATGFWGTTPHEVVRRLLDRAMEEQAIKMNNWTDP